MIWKASLHPRKTPALLITPSKSRIPTPLATPLPPFASRSMLFNTSSETSSLRTSRATLLKEFNVITSPSPPPPICVKSLNALSTSSLWLPSLSFRLFSFKAATATKCAYAIAPSPSGSAASSRSRSSEGEEGGTPSAVRARRREPLGNSLSLLAKSWKASLISASVEAEMLFSLARADCLFSLGCEGPAAGTGGAAVRFLGGWTVQENQLCSCDAGKPVKIEIRTYHGLRLVV